jgi:KDO2-lipid IV(A) lauroyltransferase
MAKPRNKYLDYLGYVGFRVFEMFVRMFDVRTNYHTFRLLGDLAHRFDRRHRNRAIGHLRKSFPDWGEEEYERVARESMRSLLYLALETLFTTRLITPTSWRRHGRLANQGQNIRLLLERKSPLIYVTGHFGNWEIVAYTMSMVGFPTYAIARPLDNPYVSKYLKDVRENSGLRILDKKGASMLMDEILGSRGAASWVADQDAGRKGLYVDFFGRQASTFKSIALLAMRYEAPIVVGYGLRLDEGYHFEVGIQRIIDPSEWVDKDDPQFWITQEYTKALEELARAYPEQYLWVHRRWKHRPKGQERGPDGIA